MFFLGFVILLASTIFEANARLSIDQKIENAARLGRLAGKTAVPEDSVLVELDILYKKEHWAEIQRKESREEGGRYKRKAIRDERYRWTDNSVPYEFQQGVFSDEDLRIINLAIDDWNTYTCLNLRPRNQDVNYMYIEDQGGCTAYVGMIGGGQMVSLGDGCRTVDIALHEIGHAIGLQHEQCRSDRDEFVDVHLENAWQGTEHNFDKHPPEEIRHYDVLYDYRSIMHYSQLAFTNNQQPTITTKDPFFQRLIGYSKHLSFRDIRIVNEMYNCNAHCSPQSCPGEGFVGKDCQCWCPGNPIQLCGPTNPEVPEDECVDDHPSCPVFAERGDCETSPAWMFEMCHLSCKLCNPNNNCVDLEGNCDFYAQSGWCTSERDYMNYYCQKSCKFCNPM